MSDVSCAETAHAGASGGSNEEITGAQPAAGEQE